MTSILLTYSFMTFLSSEQQQKKYFPRAFFPWKFASTPDCFELLWTSASLCKCTEGIPCQRYQNGLQIYMANIIEHKLNVFFLETIMPALGHFKLCCCQKQSKFSSKRKKEICPNYFWFFVLFYYYYFFFFFFFGFWSSSNVECCGFLVYNLILVFFIIC